MMLRLRNPLWTHLARRGFGFRQCAAAGHGAHPPARRCRSISVGMVVPTRWGSVAELWVALVFLPLAMLVGSVCLDELFVRHERRRQFNWLSLLDEAGLSLSFGLTLNMVDQFSASSPGCQFFRHECGRGRCGRRGSGGFGMVAAVSAR